MNDGDVDVVIIGAGIAGASVAAQLSPKVRVAVLERESQPGYHTTGRSAAIFSEIYGSPPIRALSRASHAFLFDPPRGFSDTPLVSRRGSLFIARADQVDRLDAFTASPEIAAATQRLSTAQARTLCAALRPDYVRAALHEASASDLDVHALLHGFLRQVRQHGGRLVTGAAVLGLEYAQGRWHVRTTDGEFTASIVVNAAGAWVDRVAALAGAAPIGIAPLRRTAAIADLPDHPGSSAWPMVIDVDEQFYFKPDAGRILLSPADETPSVPCDALPEHEDVAVAVERIENATTLRITRVGREWAGLRCFVADRSPVVGHDPLLPGFFWLAALGGYGIQTAPAMGRLASALVLGQPLPADLLDTGFEIASVGPGRLAESTTRLPGMPTLTA